MLPSTVPGDLSNGAASNAQNAGPRRLVVLAYIVAISIPPLGVILGIVLILRSGGRHTAHGVAVVVLSVIVSVLWVVFLTSGAFNTPSSSSNY